MLHALGRLRGAMDDAFGRISSRLAHERERVGAINTRINTCQSKVTLISGSNKATTVFSTAKYPAPKRIPNFLTLFSNKADVDPPPYPDADDSIHYTLPSPGTSVLSNPELDSEVDELLRRLNAHDTDMEKVELTMEAEGLGSLPLYVPSVSSLLLFNSNVNPYKNYSTLDNLLDRGRVREAAEDVSTHMLLGLQKP
jgi:hypothetical protein